MMYTIATGRREMTGEEQPSRHHIRVDSSKTFGSPRWGEGAVSEGGGGSAPNLPQQ